MFSTTTEYAMRAMAWLALTPYELVPTATLAAKTKVPPPYLSKVLQQLVAAGLIEGRRGVHGGYKLARAGKEITLLDVFRAVAKVDRITTCPLGLSNHGPNLCPLHRSVDLAAKRVIEVYGAVTLDSLVSEPGMNKPLCDTETTARLTISGLPSKKK